MYRRDLDVTTADRLRPLKARTAAVVVVPVGVRAAGPDQMGQQLCRGVRIAEG